MKPKTDAEQVNELETKETAAGSITEATAKKHSTKTTTTTDSKINQNMMRKRKTSFLTELLMTELISLGTTDRPITATPCTAWDGTDLNHKPTHGNQSRTFSEPKCYHIADPRNRKYQQTLTMTLTVELTKNELLKVNHMTSQAGSLYYITSELKFLTSTYLLCRSASSGFPLRYSATISSGILVSGWFEKARGTHKPKKIQDYYAKITSITRTVLRIWWQVR